MATVGAQRLLEVWDQEDARELVVDLASRGFFDEADDSGGNAADQEGGADDTSSWELFMEVDKGTVKIGDDMGVAMDEGRPSLSKAEVGYTANVERILANLTGPLEVTYTVDPREVLQNLAAWEPAIRKEVKTVEIAIQRLMREGDLAVEARSSTVAI
eukprot:s163_g11.t1